MHSSFFILQFVDGLGRSLLGWLSYTRHVFAMIYLAFRTAMLEGRQSFATIGKVVLTQIYFTGFQALTLIGGIAVAISSIVVLQSSSHLNFLGDSQMIGQVMVTVVIRELAPMITALIVIARSGTAVASEIGNMRVNREIEALEVMGINPLGFIVFPRLAGGIISVVCLSLYFVYIAILGGFVFAKIILNMPLTFYIETILQNMTLSDVYMFAVKNIFSGAIIFTVCCYQGLKVKQGPHEVPQATTSAVVNSLLYVMAFNITTTILFYLNQIISMGLL
jgi:phospholipid/cholesterol/gamma-HCH transport system permease protein